MRTTARRGVALATLGTILTLATVTPAMAGTQTAASSDGVVVQLVGVVTGLVHALLGGL